ncbi:unnamed protein product [Amoebophrya sp. A120]|nr:unnamed protein product [Amoebophrya sp. A120]|eukprot:GSA120T00021390001.1
MLLSPVVCSCHSYKYIFLNFVLAPDSEAFILISIFSSDCDAHKKMVELCEKMQVALQAQNVGDLVQVVGQLAQVIERQQDWIPRITTEMNLLQPLLVTLPEIDFEGRKDVMTLFANICRSQTGIAGGSSSSTAPSSAGGGATSAGPPVNSEAEYTPFEQYVVSQKLIPLIAERYARSPEISLNYGIVLRELCRCPGVNKHALDEKIIYQLFEIARTSDNFDLASDAFLSVKELLCRAKQLSARWILANFDEFFRNYHDILLSTYSEHNAQEDLYICQRQSLKLLSDMLLDRQFMQIMLQYINSEEYLKVHMTFLRSSSKTIQFEAFHVFKIFAANPNKPRKITIILHQNRDRLVDFLDTFLIPDRQQDQQFIQDKNTVIDKLRRLQHPDTVAAPPAPAPTSGGGAPAAPSAGAGNPPPTATAAAPAPAANQSAPPPAAANAPLSSSI